MRRLRLSAAIAALTLMSALTQQAAARSWRINSNTTRKAHFVDINAAMSSSDVVDGDTLYLDPGCLLTAKQTVSKRVTIVGTGYYLDAGVHQAAVIKGALYLRAEGCKIEGTQISGRTYIFANHVTVERCMTYHIGNADNITAQYATIRQCYIPNGQIYGRGTNSNDTAYWTIENCIIIYTDDYDPIKNLYAPTIRNNYVRPNYKSASASVAYMTNAVVQNNIFINTKFVTNANPHQMTDCVITNNVMHAESMKATYPDNIYITSNTEEAVFALEGTNDQRYTLKADSPARGAATDGGDCGPTGGLYPYVPSGFPYGMPHFQANSISPRPQSGQVKVTQQVSIQNQ